uniref:Uncharacterized protein n=1 Tax=Anguilla anguilla TaxID=7936 RepID=A0A0E9QGX8_ANGAN
MILDLSKSFLNNVLF